MDPADLLPDLTLAQPQMHHLVQILMLALRTTRPADLQQQKGPPIAGNDGPEVAPVVAGPVYTFGCT